MATEGWEWRVCCLGKNGNGYITSFQTHAPQPLHIPMATEWNEWLVAPWERVVITQLRYLRLTFHNTSYDHGHWMSWVTGECLGKNWNDYITLFQTHAPQYFISQWPLNGIHDWWLLRKEWESFYYIISDSCSTTLRMTMATEWWESRVAVLEREGMNLLHGVFSITAGGARQGEETCLVNKGITILLLCTPPTPLTLLTIILGWSCNCPNFVHFVASLLSFKFKDKDMVSL